MQRCLSCNTNRKIIKPEKNNDATRDRLEEVGNNIDKNKQWVDDKRSLLNDYISVEELEHAQLVLPVLQNALLVLAL